MGDWISEVWISELGLTVYCMCNVSVLASGNVILNACEDNILEVYTHTYRVHFPPVLRLGWTVHVWGGVGGGGSMQLY